MNSCGTLYDRLSEFESDALIFFLRENNTDEIIDILRDFLRIPSPATSNHSYNSKLEDDVFRGEILLNSFLKATKYGFKMGFSSIQLRIWLITLLDTHSTYFESVRKRNGVGVLKCMEIFKSKLSEHGMRSRRVFLEVDIERLFEYFRISYAQHIKLITWTFSKSQEQTMIHLKRLIRLPFTPQPLNEAIPNEKYDDWCKQQAEKIQKEKQEEEARLNKIKLQQEEEARLAIEAERRALVIEQQAIAEKELLSPITDQNKKYFPQVITQLVQLDLDAQNVAKVLESKSDIVKREIEVYLDEKLESHSQLMSEKFQKLEKVLAGKEVIKKIQTK